MNVIKIIDPPSIIAGAAVVGEKERGGPLGDKFDLHDATGTFGMNTWEKAESEMQRLAVNTALSKAKLENTDLDVIFAGDLLNQCVGSTYGILGFETAYLGIYGACSTFTEGLLIASLTAGAGYFKKCAVVTSSHFCTAERQFRFPNEYGGQRPPTSQWTVTGAGAAILSSEGDGPYITDVLPGIPVDKGIKDANNMGAAMAPAAIDTFNRYFSETKTQPSDYDLILTGDLGAEGHGIVCDFMKNAGYDMTKNYNDCGLLIYGRKTQDVHSGGSGCGCAASVFSAYILDKIKSGELNDIIFAATGALMNSDSIKQGNSIPGIAHLVHITNKRSR